MIKPALQDDAFLTDVRSARSENAFFLWWLGQSGFLVRWRDQFLLLDPYLSDSLTKKYENTDKPHIRMSERVIDPSLLKKISVVTSSHNHTDHLDAETLLPVLENNPGIQLIIPEANRDFVAERLQCDRNFPVGLTDNSSTTIDVFEFYGVPAKHNEIERDESGNCRYMGYVIKFGNNSVYHSGDTLWFDNMVDLLKPFSLSIALLPINGNDPARKVAGNLNTREAAELGKNIGAGMVVPCHYDMFTFNTSDVNEFIHEAKKIDQPYTVLEPGGRLSWPLIS